MWTDLVWINVEEKLPDKDIYVITAFKPNYSDKFDKKNKKY